jgi:hypothetical protein
MTLAEGAIFMPKVRYDINKELTPACDFSCRDDILSFAQIKIGNSFVFVMLCRFYQFARASSCHPLPKTFGLSSLRVFRFLLFKSESFVKTLFSNLILTFIFYTKTTGNEKKRFFVRI